MKGIILTGGVGARLYPLIMVISKQFLGYGSQFGIRLNVQEKPEGLVQTFTIEREI